MQDDLVKSKLAHLEEIRKGGIQPYPHCFKREFLAAELQEKYRTLNPGEQTNDRAIVAGRVKAIRSMGKLGFADVFDGSGKIQVSAKEDETEKQSMRLFPLIDTGDFVGAEGTVFRTKRGELTILAKKLTLLCKSILPLPEKWHGLKDIETRYRQRYLDMVMNPEVKEVLEKRSKIISAIREFMDNRGFVEAETPLLQPQYGGANAKPFITHSNALDAKLYLSISPELYLKRLIVGGIEKVYTISKNFRNEDIDKTHNPEFTSLECYAAYWDYNEMMALTEDLIEFLAKKINKSAEIEYQGTKISLKKPWKRLAIYDGLKQAGIDAEKKTEKELEALLAKHAPEYNGPKIKGLMVAELFAALCEEKLIQPTFVTDWPIETTPLCKPHRAKKGLIERFEPVINAWEIGNAYSELNDPGLQRDLLEKQSKEGRANGEQMPVDEDFIKAIEYGMPPCGGLGLGIDRIAMLLTNQPTIKDVIAFPQMKPEKK